VRRATSSTALLERSTPRGGKTRIPRAGSRLGPDGGAQPHPTPPHPMAKAASALSSLQSLRDSAGAEAAPPALQRWHSSSGHITRLRQLAAQGADHLQRLHDETSPPAQPEPRRSHW